MKKVFLFLFITILSPLSAEDKIALIKMEKNEKQNEQILNEVIKNHNQMGFELREITPLYLYHFEGGIQSKPFGTLKIPTEKDTFSSQRNSSFDGSMNGQMRGQGYPSQLLLKFCK